MTESETLNDLQIELLKVGAKCVRSMQETSPGSDVTTRVDLWVLGASTLAVVINTTPAQFISWEFLADIPGAADDVGAAVLRHLRAAERRREMSQNLEQAANMIFETQDTSITEVDIHEWDAPTEVVAREWGAPEEVDAHEWVKQLGQCDIVLRDEDIILVAVDGAVDVVRDKSAP